MFDQPGQFDEGSLFTLFRTPELRALDQSIKANARLAQIQSSLAMSGTNVERTSAAQEARIAELERRTLALGLYAQALAQILVSKGIATSEEIKEAVIEIDLLDGKLDGR